MSTQDAKLPADSQPIGFMSRATYSTSSGAGYKQITFRFTELDDANQIRLWAMSCGAKAANHVVPKPQLDFESLSQDEIDNACRGIYHAEHGLYYDDAIARAIERACAKKWGVKLAGIVPKEEQDK